MMKPDYQQCPVNIANSILKYFGCQTYHESLREIDEVLEKTPYRNVIVYLADGMGTKMMDQHLRDDDFLMRHRVKTLSSVYPPTTTAATTSILTGLTPAEHGWLGWDVYFKKEDAVIAMFWNKFKNTMTEAADYHVAETTMPTRELNVLINENENHHAEFLFGFKHTVYSDYEDLEKKIHQYCNVKEKNYIYIYDTQPDSALHEEGCMGQKAHDHIQRINALADRLSHDLQDTLLIVTADHGHHDVEHYFVEDIPEMAAMLEHDTSIEPRAVSFKIKDGMHQRFEELFEEHFGRDFRLLTREQVKAEGWFGPGEFEAHIDDSIGDYIAMATGNYDLVRSRDYLLLKSQHAGITKDEMEIPLILIECQ